MDDLAVGRAFRSLRIRHQLRQEDVARRVGVSSDVVSRLENGHLERLSFGTIRRLWAALGMVAEVDPRLSPAERAQLLDAGHAALVELALRRYRESGWQTVAEYTFNHFGERGSVDLLAWRPDRRALAINEIKTRIPDVQGTIAGSDRRERIVPAVVSRDRGWRPAVVGRILMLADTRATRRVVATHSGTFASTFPQRTRAAEAWIRDPAGPIAALWFLPYPTEARRYASRSRFRPSRRPITPPEAGR